MRIIPNGVIVIVAESPAAQGLVLVRAQACFVRRTRRVMENVRNQKSRHARPALLRAACRLGYAATLRWLTTRLTPLVSRAIATAFSTSALLFTVPVNVTT